MLKWLGRLLLALLLSLLVGLAIGTLLRLRLERPVYYIGAAAVEQEAPGRSGALSLFDRGRSHAKRDDGVVFEARRAEPTSERMLPSVDEFRGKWSLHQMTALANTHEGAFCEDEGSPDTLSVDRMRLSILRPNLVQYEYVDPVVQCEVDNGRRVPFGQAVIGLTPFQS